VLLGLEYPKRIWTKIESDAFKERFIDGSVIPIWFSDIEPSMFDTSREKGGITIDSAKDIGIQIESIVTTVLSKLTENR
jgi:hypothetical protein